MTTRDASRGRSWVLALCWVVASFAAQVGAQDFDWPRWLGPTSDATYRGPQISEVWREPPVLFRLTLGEGFSAPVVVGERLVVFHRVGGVERLEAFDRLSGKSLWQNDLRTSYRDDFGFDEGPRATPEIVGTGRGKARRIVALGAEGVLRAVDFETGELVWQVHTRRTFSAAKGFFGAASGPLTLGDRVLLNVGGTDAGIVGFALDDGEVAWTAGSDEAGYSTPVAATLDGLRVAVFLTRDGLKVLEPGKGEILYEMDWRSRSRSSVNAASPLVVGKEIFLSASYGIGATLVRAEGGKIEPIWASDDRLSNHYATSVLHEGVLFGFHGRQEHGQIFRAISWRDGALRWEQPLSRAGSVLLIASEAQTARLLILGEDGRLRLARASGERFELITEAQILEPTVRAYPALVDATLYARNGVELIAIDLNVDSER